MNSLTLSLGQISIEIGQPLKNLDKAVTMVRSAAAYHSRMILFPELWTSGYDLANSEKYALINAEIEIQLQALAEELNIIIGGSYITADSSGFHNTFKLIHPGQKQEHPYYNKIHLFRLLAEDQWFIPGQKPTTIEYPWAKTGLSICYDLRFPEFFRNLALRGAGLFSAPAAWPLARAEEYRLFCRARAAENRAYLISANWADSGDGEYGGGSLIADPYGRILAQCGAGEGLALAELDTELLRGGLTFNPLADRRQFLDEIDNNLI